MTALNSKLKRDGGSERPKWEEMVALNIELGMNGGSES